MISRKPFPIYRYLAPISGWMSLLVFPFLALSLIAATMRAQPGARTEAYLLKPEHFHHYFTKFQQQEIEATGRSSDDGWLWMQSNIPWFEASDANFQQIYYFRWYSLKKHIVHSEEGDLLSEFLYTVHWAGYGNTDTVAVPHQLREVRWLRNPGLANDYARFWFSPRAPHNRDYSVALADAVRAVTLATGDTRLGTDLLPQLVANYYAWESTHQDTNGLFWSIDTRDGMEVSISGDGYRPTLNSYMYGDARAIEGLARTHGDESLANEFDHKAMDQRQRIEDDLWNPKDQFYEVDSPAKDSLIREQPKFKNPGSVLQFSGVRELIGFIPWYLDIPQPSHAVAWKQLFDPEGFAGRFGPPTAERRSPRFRYPNADQCQWNGPSWGFATTQTLVGLANLLNTQKQNFVGPKDYFRLFSDYVDSHHLKLPNGEVIPWLDESNDSDTGEWITRNIIHERHERYDGRGAYYNHSGFADPLITGLIGLRPREDNVVVVNPLLPEGVWTYFAIDALPYHDHILTIFYDKTGERYHRGKGLTLLIDGKPAASRQDLGELRSVLPATAGAQ